MRFLKLCFVLMVFGISAKAQEKDTCFYHVSFYKWEWNYCYGLDTLDKYDITMEVIGDTVIMAYHNKPSWFSVERIDSASFVSPHIQITSMDGRINYKVKRTSFTLRRWGTTKRVAVCKGAYLNNKARKLFYDAGTDPQFAEAKKSFNELSPDTPIFDDQISLDYIKIHDPSLRKSILIEGITIEIK